MCPHGEDKRHSQTEALVHQKTSGGGSIRRDLHRHADSEKTEKQKLDLNITKIQRRVWVTLKEPVAPERVRVVETSGGASDRGYQYGQKCKDLIAYWISKHQEWYARYAKLSRDAILHETRKYIPYIEEYSSEIAEEMRAIAQGADTTYDEIVMLNVYYEFMFDRFMPGACTAFAAAGRATLDGNTYLGQTDDGGPSPWSDDNLWVVVKERPRTGPDLVYRVNPGWIGFSGLNSNGLGFCLNALQCERSHIGVPALTVISKDILTSRNIGDAMQSITRAKRASSANYLLADENGEIYDVESTPTTFDCLYSNDIMAHSNHFVSTNVRINEDKLLRLLPDSIVRRDRMNWLLKEQYGQFDLPKLMNVLKDHANYPNSICRHVDDRTPAEKQVQTNSACLLDLHEKELWLAMGNPCKSAFQKYPRQTS